MRLRKVSSWLFAAVLLVLGAHAMPEERQRCLVLGMNGHLGKPIDPAVLYEMLADLQARRARTRPGPTTAPVANAAQFA